MIRETLKYVIVEPLGDNSNSVEFITETKEGRVKHYQCKASNADHSEWSIADLNSYSYSCARGYAFHAIAALLRENSELSSFFVTAIRSSITDSHDEVRFAAMKCILPLYNALPDDAIEIAKGLIEADIRCIAVPGFWKIISIKYRTDGNYYFDKIDQCFNSRIDDLADIAARYLCSIAIYYDDKIALERVLSNNLSKGQKHSICEQAAFCFSQDEYHQKSQEILLHYCYEAEISSIAHLLHEKKIRIERDVEFLKCVISSSQNEYLFHAFLEFFLESELEDCLKLAPVLEVFGSQFAKADTVWSILLPEELSRCVNKLYDIGFQNQSIKQICLDIWDKFFMGNLYNAKTMRDLFESYGD